MPGLPPGQSDVEEARPCQRDPRAGQGRRFAECGAHRFVDAERCSPSSPPIRRCTSTTTMRLRGDDKFKVQEGGVIPATTGVLVPALRGGGSVHRAVSEPAQPRERSGLWTKVRHRLSVWRLIHKNSASSRGSTRVQVPPPRPATTTSSAGDVAAWGTTALPLGRTARAGRSDERAANPGDTKAKLFKVPSPDRDIRRPVLVVSLHRLLDDPKTLSLPPSSPRGGIPEDAGAPGRREPRLRVLPRTGGVSTALTRPRAGLVSSSSTPATWRRSAR